MRKYLNKLLIVAFFLIAFACSKDETENHIPKASPFNISVEGGVATIPTAGSNLNVNISAGTNGWWIVVPDQDKSWCVSSKIYGSGDHMLSLSFKSNTTGIQRSTVVTFNPTFNLDPIKLTFTQSAN